MKTRSALPDCLQEKAFEVLGAYVTTVFLWFACNKAGRSEKW